MSFLPGTNYVDEAMADHVLAMDAFSESDIAAILKFTPLKVKERLYKARVIINEWEVPV